MTISVWFDIKTKRFHFVVFSAHYQDYFQSFANLNGNDTATSGIYAI